MNNLDKLDKMGTIDAKGFRYDLELADARGEILQKQSLHNLMPVEGINYLLNVSMCDGTKWPRVYMGLFSAAYVPTELEQAATIAMNASEFTDYSGAARPEVRFDANLIASGFISNDHEKTVFTFTGDGTITGGFLITSPNKGGNTGVLLSIARFPSPIPGEAGRTLTVRAGILIANKP